MSRCDVRVAVCVAFVRAWRCGPGVLRRFHETSVNPATTMQGFMSAGSGAVVLPLVAMIRGCIWRLVNAHVIDLSQILTH